MNLTDELKVCKNIIKKAGKKILEIYETDFDVEYKEDDSPLTKADRVSNEIIVNELKEKFKDYAILSEESKDNLDRMDNDWCWIIDPLDGTKEFVKKNGEFTVNIALTHKKKPIFGLIYVPTEDKLYYAQKSKGAYLEDKSGKIKKLSVSDRKDNLRIVISRSHASEQVKNLIDCNDCIEEVKRAGSSLKGCLIAEGKAEVYYRYNPTMEWDTAAMHAIVEEAGGVFRKLNDKEMEYNRKNNVNKDGFYILNRKDNKLH
ncbi:MAG: 3'(2'),5'-bisphosphate nucleotidase CysQ [Candidatus Mcinerneyibacterium aminivorans]|uniref:3'(2'),5'-bisphosphate nucleotidase CysQ n=1 Tax=Candidatus Mcinerneyibacterium aminivorans TaxID=2703815 RepID=A0A5D0MG56_9BACT|nr:MAG: 3'(2'),5'-bisphosphate nucleotidase CysQ [Candidatus Mcinerneyibacterium aminivorans]